MAGTFTNLLFHIVFSTKARAPIISDDLGDELYRYLGGIIRSIEGTPLEVGGMPDHVHLLVKVKPTISLAELMRVVKTNSSKWINETHPQRSTFHWQDGYSAFSVSESQLERARAYIRNQREHHRQVPFTKELIALLQRHGVDFDPRFLDG
jgi:REP element-mobilizing transposase RayT